MPRPRLPLPEVAIDVEASWQTLESDDGHKQWHDGLGIWKSADDLQRYAAAIVTSRPEVVIETGTRWGGFALWLADSFDVEVITIDIERQPERPETYPGVHFVEGDSTSARVAHEVRRLRAGRRTMVSLDADHHTPAVEREIGTYGPLVTPGCYLVVEDTLADLLPPDRARRLGGRIPELGGPLRAVASTVEGRPMWERARDVEDLTPISHSPAGWWLRTEAAAT